MGQILHSCARTTQAMRRAIQHSQDSLAKLAKAYNLNCVIYRHRFNLERLIKLNSMSEWIAPFENI